MNPNQQRADYIRVFIDAMTTLVVLIRALKFWKYLVAWRTHTCYDKSRQIYARKSRKNDEYNYQKTVKNTFDYCKYVPITWASEIL